MWLAVLSGDGEWRPALLAAQAEYRRAMIHGFTVPAGIEIAMREKGYTSGIFGWVTALPWRNPAFSARQSGSLPSSWARTGTPARV